MIFSSDSRVNHASTSSRSELRSSRRVRSSLVRWMYSQIQSRSTVVSMQSSCSSGTATPGIAAASMYGTARSKTLKHLTPTMASLLPVCISDMPMCRGMTRGAVCIISLFDVPSDLLFHNRFATRRIVGLDPRRVEPCFQDTRSPGGGVFHIPIGAKIAEPIFLRQPIHPMLFRDFLARQPLTETRLHRFQFGHRRAADSGIAGAVLDD